jgi:hypothetical protein
MASGLDAAVARFGKAGLSEAEVERMSGRALVECLVASGVSRLSAERIVAIERGTAAPGRARIHMQSRR